MRLSLVMMLLYDIFVVNLNCSMFLLIFVFMDIGFVCAFGILVRARCGLNRDFVLIFFLIVNFICIVYDELCCV